MYWRISAALFIVLLLLGMSYLHITRFIASDYLQETNQRLYGGIADSTIQAVKPLANGAVDTLAIQDIMHSMMVINPSVEVYLLDTLGKIITYVAPNKKVKLEKIDLHPVKKYIARKDNLFIKGDDPRNPEKKKVFSAAEIKENSRLTGYLYIVLASEEREAVSSRMMESYMLKLGRQLFFLALGIALCLGMAAIWFLTKNLRRIEATVRRFKEGDMTIRFASDNSSEFADLKHTFNDMADTIASNIEQLKSIENLRRELISNVSHDLRTPLAIMQGYIETLMIKENQISKEERNRYLQTVFSSSESLAALIAQLFEYSKLEAKQVEPQKEPFFIAELAQDIFQKYQLIAKRKKIHLQLQADPNLPMVFADIALVERVIQNLMDNALNFTQSGGAVTLVLEEKTQSVEIKIMDNGPGIPEQEQSYIFERYRKADRSERKSKGAGLGLAIVKKILELHDSSIRVQSRLSEGTAFIFSLPTYS
ncbi:MAG TPA: HAMP domain-containing sensor histidine kinase [Saprospiraceae bacterium]|nr:HAMP domain-containing sensor histidine kinase [Saprospiraceae bacterium]HMQ83816.1 HAMP domain-containing sensor histidine kinase [Saprospiraceae bacterium]